MVETKPQRETASPSFDCGERKPLTLEYIAAFFDGEGSICLGPGKYSINVSLRFSQVDRGILEEIARFFLLMGVTGVGVYVGDRNRRHLIHALAISSNDGVVSALTLMAPYLRVKSFQAKVTLDYLQDKITGNQFIEAMNAEVRAGKRAGKIHAVNQPFRRSEGIEMIWGKSLAHARQIFREMASSPDGHRRFGLNAIERNVKRGIETRKKILRLLCADSKDTATVCAECGRGARHVRRLLKELSDGGYLQRWRETVVKPYVYTITERGHSYLLEGDHDAIA